MLLSDLTTIGVGGAARRLVRPSTIDDIVSTALEVWADEEPWLALGGGSNLVVADAGFDGTVIRIESEGIAKAGTRLRVQAGHSWDALVEYAVAHGLAGIEALSGIPGSCGAAPLQNIGAYGQELGDTLVGLEFLDHLTGEVIHLRPEDLGLGYRTSALKRGRTGIVLAIELQLEASDTATLDYPQLADAIGARAGLSDIRAAVLALRRSKGMVLDAGDPDSVSCGSFFTNPIVSENFARRLPDASPRWPIVTEGPDVVVPLGQPPAARPIAAESQVKLSAAWLIEHAGIGRGFSLPGSRAAISSKHTLAIVNGGSATATEVAELARYIGARVLSQFGVALQPEPVAVGVDLTGTAG